MVCPTFDMVPWKFFIIFRGVGCWRWGFWGVIFENLDCGYGIVFMAASDYALK